MYKYFVVKTIKKKLAKNFELKQSKYIAKNFRYTKCNTKLIQILLLNI